MLSRTVAPVNLPVSLDELNAHLRVTGTAEESVAFDCLSSAVEMLDGQGELGRALISQTWKLTTDSCAIVGKDLKLDLGDVQSLVSVQYRDSNGVLQDADLADFTVYSPNHEPYVRSENWPATGDYPDALQITFVAGYGDTRSSIPAPIRQAVKLLASHYFQIREPVVIGATVAKVPDGVERLIAPYKVRWV